MTKRSHQAAARYAKRSGRGKRKRLPKSHSPSEAKIAAPQTEEVQPKQLAVESRESRVETPDSRAKHLQAREVVAATYAYVASDLKRIGMITGAIFALLIVLAIIFG